MALRTACSEVTNQRIIDQKSFCDAGMVAALLEDGAAALRGCSDIGHRSEHCISVGSLAASGCSVDGIELER